MLNTVFFCFIWQCNCALQHSRVTITRDLSANNPTLGISNPAVLLLQLAQASVAEGRVVLLLTHAIGRLALGRLRLQDPLCMQVTLRHYRENISCHQR